MKTPSARYAAPPLVRLRWVKRNASRAYCSRAPAFFLSRPSAPRSGCRTAFSPSAQKRARDLDARYATSCATRYSSTSGGAQYQTARKRHRARQGRTVPSVSAGAHRDALQITRTLEPVQCLGIDQGQHQPAAQLPPRQPSAGCAAILGAGRSPDLSPAPLAPPPCLASVCPFAAAFILLLRRCASSSPLVLSFLFRHLFSLSASSGPNNAATTAKPKAVRRAMLIGARQHYPPLRRIDAESRRGGPAGCAPKDVSYRRQSQCPVCSGSCTALVRVLNESTAVPDNDRPESYNRKLSSVSLGSLRRACVAGRRPGCPIAASERRRLGAAAQPKRTLDPTLNHLKSRPRSGGYEAGRQGHDQREGSIPSSPQLIGAVGRRNPPFVENARSGGTWRFYSLDFKPCEPQS